MYSRRTEPGRLMAVTGMVLGPVAGSAAALACVGVAAAALSSGWLGSAGSSGTVGLVLDDS